MLYKLSETLNTEPAAPDFELQAKRSQSEDEMKTSEMIEIKNSRINVTAFLHFTEIKLLDEQLDQWYSVSESKPSFHRLCDEIISLYRDKKISNKKASKIFEVLISIMIPLRKESHRFDNGKIYEYSAEHRAYLFLKKGSYKEFTKLNHYID